MNTDIIESIPIGIQGQPKKSARLLGKVLDLKLGVIGGMIILGMLICAVAAPWIAPFDPYGQDIMKRLQPPVFLEGGSSEHLLGTDSVGRDTLSRIIYGTRISLTVGISAVLIQVVIGVILGLLAGFYGGKIDSAISFLVNVMMGFPFILLAISLVAVIGPSLENIIFALGITGWPVFTRVSRVETIKLRESEFVLCARTLAFSTMRILIKHILPNLLPSILVLATVEVARAIIRESLLSFLGLGIQPPTPSWGMMLAQGRDYMLSEWWLAAFPGFAIFLSALGINLLGDAMRDLLDPHMRKS
jgi:ABC-type dipeptide/oligopeptide/nickel transport system permease subunit